MPAYAYLDQYHWIHEILVDRETRVMVAYQGLCMAGIERSVPREFDMRSPGFFPELQTNSTILLGTSSSYFFFMSR